MVEHHLDTVGVGGSKPPGRTEARREIGGLFRFCALLFLSACATPVASSEAGPLRNRQHAALKAGDWLEAIRLGRARVREDGSDPGTHYDLACALARAGDGDAALASLSTAIELGFDTPQVLLRDDDLATLRSRAEFARLVERSTTVAREGLALPMLRTETREGLRLRLPLTGRPRLALWLHPSGAALNSSIERFAPQLVAAGYALAVPLAPPSASWSEEELQALLSRIVPSLSELVDVERPLLIGLSAGGHAALAAWAREPQRFGAIIATGCAPELHGAVLPTSRTPVFVINGENDPSTRLWRRALETWRGEGRSVSLTVLPGRGHEFLLDERLLHDVLTRVQAVAQPPP